MRRSILAAATVLAVLWSLALSGCGGQQASKPPPTTLAGQPTAAQPAPAQPVAPKDVPGVTKDTIVIGSWMPLTGPAAAWGEVGKGLTAYIEHLNAQGGVNGRKIKLIIEDDQYQPSRTVAAVKKMLEQDKVFALVAVIGTSNLSAVIDILKQQKVPVVGYLNGASKFSDPVNPYAFAGLMTYETEAKLLTRYAVETLKLKKLGVLYQNDDFGKEGLAGVKAAAAKMGAQLVAEVAYAPTDPDVSAYTLKFKEAGAEAVLVWSTVKHGSLLIKDARKIGYQPKFLTSAVVADTNMPKLAEGAAEGMNTVAYAATLTDTNHPVVKEFLEVAPKYIKGNLTQSQLTGWANGRLLAEGLRRAGPDLDREKLVKALETLKDWQNTALITYTATDHRGFSSGWIRQLKGDKYVDVSDPIKVD